MHIHSGAIATEDVWRESYDNEELEFRGLTIDEAFEEDYGNTLVEVSE